MSEYAKGGLIPGTPLPITIERLGVGPDGHCLYSINGVPPELIFTAEQARRLARKSGILAELNKSEDADE